MTYTPNLNKLIGYIPADVYAEHEKQITELADAIAKDRARLKEAVLESWYQDGECIHCEDYCRLALRGAQHPPDCIVCQLEEGE